jgi:cytochrome oxidase Cu insertion factor (SCO1/SenC/PrrC family)
MATETAATETTATEIATHSPGKNRLSLLMIIALFVIPLLIAWLLVGRWQPGAMSNHGELLNPARPVPRLDLALSGPGERLDRSYLRGRWTLMYMGADGKCGEVCRNGLYNVRQACLALGKDRVRVQTLFAMTGEPTPELETWLQQEHAVMTRGIADSATRDFFAQAFSDRGARPGDWIYLIDPLGNLVMRYRVENNPKGILDDMKHLLKLSKIG